MGLRPQQQLGPQDNKQDAELYVRISQETFDQACRGLNTSATPLRAEPNQPRASRCRPGGPGERR